MYTTFGPTRGTCGHHHSTVRDAELCLTRYRSSQQARGNYSDRRVVAIIDDTVWIAAALGGAAVRYLNDLELREMYSYPRAPRDTSGAGIESDADKPDPPLGAGDRRPVEEPTSDAGWNPERDKRIGFACRVHSDVNALRRVIERLHVGWPRADTETIISVARVATLALDSIKGAADRATAPEWDPEEERG